MFNNLKISFATVPTSISSTSFAIDKLLSGGVGGGGWNC